jgi:hypothetical protein
MAQDIDDLPPMSGRMLREDGTVFNVADYLTDYPIATMHVRTTQPPDPGDGNFWLDPTGPTLRIWNGTAWNTVTIT